MRCGCFFYHYDANNNLLTVTDWANRTTSYSYDVNNRLIGTVKPDGSYCVLTYDNKQRLVSAIEKTPYNTVISGFEYAYDNLSRIVEEKNLVKCHKLCYTYDELDRVTKRTELSICDNTVISEQSFSYDVQSNRY